MIVVKLKEVERPRIIKSLGQLSMLAKEDRIESIAIGHLADRKTGETYWERMYAQVDILPREATDADTGS